MPTDLVIHGHFYQPPRENPWTGHIDNEPSAQPFPNWNERIHHECYRPNGYARVLDPFGRIERIVDNYQLLSFNFGPTLFSWLAEHHPGTYHRLLAADRASVAARGGHGNAIAQAYNHPILPLCNERDLRTQVRWGVADFRYRFGREPEALWLPETACNAATLAALIEEGMRYAILSPYQAERVRPLGKKEWRDVGDGTIDPGVAYRAFHPDGSGRFLDLFFYDGPISKAVAFEGLLGSSQGLVDRLKQAPGGEGRLVHLATDGESYGHHFHRGERGLAYALSVLAPAQGFRVTNYGEFLEAHPPTHEVEIKAGPDGEGTSWSCAHGVGRWRRDCGCHTGGQAGWNQAWREPLRQALDLLRDVAIDGYLSLAAEVFVDPWSARDDYIRVVLDPRNGRYPFYQDHARGTLREADQIRGLTALEMQRFAMLMYTSCGWFFNDLSGIETIQVLRYAGRVLDLMDELDMETPRERFREVLAEARSNIPEQGNGADVFRRHVESARVTAFGVAASIALPGLVTTVEDDGAVAGYLYRCQDFEKEAHGRLTLATSRIELESTTTGKILEFAVAAIYFGGIDFYCVLKLFPGTLRFRRSAERLWHSFRTASLPSILRIAEREFGPDEYGLEHLLPEARNRISETVFSALVDRFADQYARLYEDNRRVLGMLREAGFVLPRELRTAAELTLGRRFEEELRRQTESLDPEDYQQAEAIAGEVARGGFRINRTTADRSFGDRVTDAVLAAVPPDPAPERLEAALSLIALTKRLGLQPELERAQEAVVDAVSRDGEHPPLLVELGLELGLSPTLFAPDPAPAETAGQKEVTK